MTTTTTTVCCWPPASGDGWELRVLGFSDWRPTATYHRRQADGSMLVVAVEVLGSSVGSFRSARVEEDSSPGRY